MAILNTNTEEASVKFLRALSGWDNEGSVQLDEEQAGIHVMTNAELVHLRIRVIALENLIITLLAEGSDRQLEIVREMANYIRPRAGFTQHPLTIKAADQMNDMVIALSIIGPCSLHERGLVFQVLRNSQ